MTHTEGPRPIEPETPQPVRAAIALGSNLVSERGDRAAHLAFATDALAHRPGVTLLRVSDTIETAPVGDPDQGPYLNAAAIVETALEPHDLLEAMLQVERDAGRVRDPARRFGPRTLDLDLLLYADRVIDTDTLTLPHPRLTERLFVLEPLAQIAPDWVVPAHDRTPAMTVADHLARLRQISGGSPGDGGSA